jgi:hypothetical protein
MENGFPRWASKPSEEEREECVRITVWIRENLGGEVHLGTGYSRNGKLQVIVTVPEAQVAACQQQMLEEKLDVAVHAIEENRDLGQMVRRVKADWRPRWPFTAARTGRHNDPK